MQQAFDLAELRHEDRYLLWHHHEQLHLPRSKRPHLVTVPSGAKGWRGGTA